MSIHFKASLSAAVSVGAILAVSSAVAQQTANPSDPVEVTVTAPRGDGTEQTTAGPVRGYQAITSSSATRTQTPIQQLPQSVQVLPRKVLEDQGVISQSEALLNVAGVQPLNVVTFGQLNPKVRGFSAERVVDGLPNYYDSGARDLTRNIERIEVLKGPQGVLFSGGTNATSGVINVASKLPTPVRFAEFGVTAGGYRLWSPYFDINQPLTQNGTVLFRMTGQYEGTRALTDVLDRRSYSLNPTLVLTNNAGTTLTLQGHLSRREQQDYSALPAVGTIDRSQFSIRRALFPGAVDVPKTHSTLASITAKLDHAFNNVWSSSTSLRIGRSKFEEPSQGLTSNQPVIGPSTFESYDLRIQEKTLETSFNSSLTGKFDYGWHKHTVLFGVDYNKVTEKGGMWGSGCSQLFFAFGFCPAIDTQLVDYANPVFARYQDRTTPYFLVNNTYVTKGATAQIQSSFHDRLHILAGGRLANVNIKDDDGTGFRAGLTGSNIARTDKTKFLPRLGVSFELTKSIALFAGYSEGMRPVPFFFGTAPMKPEESRQIEAGVKINTGYGLSGTVATFQLDRKNVPVSNGNFGSVQSGDQRSRGLEADLIWQPNANWSIMGSYARVEAEVRKDTNVALIGRTLVGVPRDSGRLWVNYAVTDGMAKGLSLGAGLYATSEQVVELGQSWRTPGYVTFDAKIGYEYQNWKFQVVGKNLADRKYFQPYAYLSGRVAPGDGRTVYATVSTKF